MDDCTMPVAISALACAIAKQINNTDELALVATIFNQLSSALGIIIAERALCDSQKKAEELGKFAQ